MKSIYDLGRTERVNLILTTWERFICKLFRIPTYVYVIRYPEEKNLVVTKQIIHLIKNSGAKQ